MERPCSACIECQKAKRALLGIFVPVGQSRVKAVQVTRPASDCANWGEKPPKAHSSLSPNQLLFFFADEVAVYVIKLEDFLAIFVIGFTQ